MPSSTIYHRDYYLEQKNKIQDYNKSYRTQNRIYYKLYYLNNRQKLLEYGKNYYNTHREHCRSLNIAWKMKNIPNYRKTKTKQQITFQKINQPTIVSFN
jgi:predicted SAM-dependent methyltransferase